MVGKMACLACLTQLLFIVLLLGCAAPMAQTPLPPPAVTIAPPEPIKSPKEIFSKMQSPLGEMVEAYKTKGIAGAEEVAAMQAIKIRDGKILVVVVIEQGDTTSLAQAIAQQGGEVGTIASDRVSALVPIAVLEDIASLPEVKVIRLPLPVVPSSGEPTKP